MSASNPLTTSGVLRSLPHDLLADVAREWMLWGHLIDRALMPELIVAVDISAMEAVAIDEWMGASPNYTERLRRLMGIDGDTVADIMKALQLDSGFVHEYMDVGYSVADEHHGEFWLHHCGALVDAEPMGERQVISMCHHIEDPTFDATALATNPAVRIRPIHRPPRTPADRQPVCHWTVVIDPANPPVEPSPLTGRVAALALAAAPVPVIERTGDGLEDYRGAFVPGLRLDDLSSGALRALARELAMQVHLISAAAQLSITDRHGADIARTVVGAQAVGVSWVGAQRLARALGWQPAPEVGADLATTAPVLAANPLWPSGVEATVEVDGDSISLRVDAAPGVLDPAQPGWLGLLAAGDHRAIEAAANGLDRRLRVSPTGAGEGWLTYRVAPDPAGESAAVPRVVELLHFSSAADWEFSRT